MRQMLRQTTGYGQTGICFVMTKTAMLKGYTLKVVCEICGKVSGHYSDRFVTATNGSSLLIICIGPRNGQAVVEMKRFLKPRSGCGRPDLGENVHRISLEKHCSIHNQSVSARMIIAYGFFRLYKKKNAPPSTATHLDRFSKIRNL